jgi:hypothetical protein
VGLHTFAATNYVERLPETSFIRQASQKFGSDPVITETVNVINQTMEKLAAEAKGQVESSQSHTLCGDHDESKRLPLPPIHENSKLSDITRGLDILLANMKQSEESFTKKITLMKKEREQRIATMGSTLSASLVIALAHTNPNIFETDQTEAERLIGNDIVHLVKMVQLDSKQQQ